MKEKSEKSTIGLFTGVPPEHNSHILSSIFFARAINTMGFGKVIGLTANPERPEYCPMPEIVSSVNPYELVAPITIPNIPFYNFASLADGYRLNSKAFKRCINSQGIDTVFMTYFPLFGEEMIRALKETRVKVLLLVKIAMAHENEPTFSFYHRGYENALNMSDHVFVMQPFDRALLMDRYNLHEDKISVLTKFTDDELLEEAPKQAEETVLRLGLGDAFLDSGQIVAYLGRMEAVKNTRVLLKKIWPQVHQSQPKAKLVIVGTGGREMNDINDLKNKSIYAAKGSLSNLEVLAFLSKVDILAFPGGRDYIPRIPMEALKMGAHVVLNNQPFNQIYQPFSHMVSVAKYATYQEYGHNNPMGIDEATAPHKSYGIPNTQEFANKILYALGEKERVKLSDEMFSSTQFRLGLKNALLQLTE